jgi:hypothetical protein
MVLPNTTRKPAQGKRLMVVMMMKGKIVHRVAHHHSLSGLRLIIWWKPVIGASVKKS